MNQIERIIDFMVKRQGQRFTMQSDDNCILHTAEGRQPLNQLMTVAEIETVVQGILPQHLQPSFAEPGTLVFPYASSQGAMTLRVTRRNGSLRVSLYQGEVVPDETDDDFEQEASAPPIITPSPSPEPPTPPSLSSVSALPQVPPTVQEPATSPTIQQTENLPPASLAEPPLPVAVREQVTPDYLFSLFQRAIQQRASDLHLRADAKPFLRVREKLEIVSDVDALTAAQLSPLIWQMAPPRCQTEWTERGETAFGYDFQGRARFRCQVFQERQGVAAAFRLVPAQVRTLDMLGLPETVKHLAASPSGIVIVSGGTRSGKSTTLAAIIEHINQNRSAHVVTIEEPIEFVHRSARCLITQREVPTHVPSRAAAWRGLARTDADVCVMGALSDDNLREAMDAAEQGRLVLMTMAQQNATSVVVSLLHPFPPAEREQVSLRLTRSLKGVIVQTLCCDTQGGQVAAVEILVMTSPVAVRIREGNFGDLEGLMWSGSEGMMTLNESLITHVHSGRITLEEARRKSLDPHGLERLSR
jgi:twitching motility protein PilT